MEQEKIKRLEELLRAANVAITESGHDISICDGGEECYLCEAQNDINEYFEN